MADSTSERRYDVRVKRVAHRIIRGLEERIDRRMTGRPATSRVVLQPYRGFGRTNELLVRARVLVEKKITRVNEAESLGRNLLNTFRRFQSDDRLDGSHSLSHAPESWVDAAAAVLHRRTRSSGHRASGARRHEQLELSQLRLAGQ